MTYVYSMFNILDIARECCYIAIFRHLDCKTSSYKCVKQLIPQILCTTCNMNWILHFHPMPLLLLFMRLFVVGLTIAAPSMLVSPWDALHSLSACLVQQVCLLVSKNLTMSCNICMTCSTGFLFPITLNLGSQFESGSHLEVPQPTCGSFVASPQFWLPHNSLFDSMRYLLSWPIFTMLHYYCLFCLFTFS